MTTPAQTDVASEAASNIDEGIPQFGRFAFLVFGVVGGFVVTIAVAFAVLMGRTGTPNYVELPAPVGPAALAPAEVQGEVILAATEFAFAPNPVTGPSALEIVLENQGLVFHNLEIEGITGFIIEAEAGVTASASIALDPGSYTIFCSVPGHRQAGMEAQLTIEG